MRRLLNYPLVGALCFLGLATFWLLEPAAAEALKLPKIDKLQHKGYTEKIPSSEVSFEMVPIPGGTFLMGSPPAEKNRREDEGPQHPVTIRPFWMGKCEVTWDEWDLYKKEAGVENKEAGNLDPGENEKRLKADPDAITGPTPPYADETFGHMREGHPVLGLSHHCCMEYCRWLSKKTGKVYRLPTEAEWEWACRAGTTTAYSWGDDPAKIDEYAWHKGNSDGTTKPVGKKKPNPWGLHDMHGNIAEWCLDHYKKDYYATFSLDKPALWPVLVPTAARWSHVCRGGSWADPAKECRSAARRGSDIKWIRQDPQRPRSIWWLTDAEFVGMRVVRAVVEQDNLKGLRSKITRMSN
jgi:formylglycine-generating enzyme required for sulfatase activity